MKANESTCVLFIVRINRRPETIDVFPSLGRIEQSQAKPSQDTPATIEHRKSNVSFRNKKKIHTLKHTCTRTSNELKPPNKSRGEHDDFEVA